MEWIRATDLFRGTRVLALFESIEPADLLQGELGNCWLLAAAASVAQSSPERIRAIFLDRDLRPDGLYTLALWDFRTQAWEHVTESARAHRYDSVIRYMNFNILASRPVVPMLAVLYSTSF